MTRVNIQEAKTHFSKLIKQVKAGERVVICDRNVPVAELREVSSEKLRKRKEAFGAYAGQIEIADDFDAPLPEFESDSNGNLILDDVDGGMRVAEDK